MEKDDNVLWMEIVQRLTKIEENTKGIEQVSDKASRALAKAEENEKDIAEIKENQKWTWRTIAGIGVSVIVYILNKIIGGL